MEIIMKIEQRIIMKFLVKAGKTNVELWELLLSVYGNTTMCCAMFFEWIYSFWEERECVFDDEWERRPITVLKSDSDSCENENQEKVPHVAERCCMQCWNFAWDCL